MLQYFGLSMDPLILASKSPRRREILERLNIPYIVYEPDVDETVEKRGNIRSLVIAIAKRKVEKVVSYFSSGLVVGADTVVCFQNRILGKPRDRSEAQKFIRVLNGNRHVVISGISVKDAARGLSYSSVSETVVFFYKLTDEEIDRYIECGEWFDKAGGYAVQGQAALFIEKIVGSYYNIMGLPVEQLYILLKRFSFFDRDGDYAPVRRPVRRL